MLVGDNTLGTVCGILKIEIENMLNVQQALKSLRSQKPVLARL